MTLCLTNTISRKKEIFSPLKEGEVSIYCCGVTVYDLCHLGHARSYISWDVLRRYLIWEGYKVNFVQNFTDIDDKILRKAVSEGTSMQEVSERNIYEFHKDMDGLGIMRPDKMPRATNCLHEIRNFIKELEDKDIAYSKDGDVYFSIAKKSDYGKLSQRNLNEQQLNADGRMEAVQEARKENPFDFALWKKANPGEPGFPSPWGHGRPGWHIECSAMVRKELGETIDIHLGGSDLIFPHHENEIAQSESVTGKALARYWLHNGMVNVQGQKMSKSLGNFTTIRDLINDEISPMTLRLFVLQAHYRKPLDFTNNSLKAAALGWKGLNNALAIGHIYSGILGWDDLINNYKDAPISLDKVKDLGLADLRDRFKESMDDDLNTSAALSIIFELGRPLRSISNCIQRGEDTNSSNIQNIDNFFKWKLLCELSLVLGLKPELEDTKSSRVEGLSINLNEIKLAINERKEAKLKGDFVKADLIRDKMKSLGVELIDKSNGLTEWIRSEKK